MKHTLLLLFFFLLFQNSRAQSTFSNGFESGYMNGYCQDQGISCIAPNPPIAPIPTVNENLNSYKDGYNRGFQIGLQAQKTGSNTSRRVSSGNMTNNTSSTENKGYQTAKPIYVDDKMFNPFGNMNMNDLMAIANMLKKMKGTALEYLNQGDYQSAANLGFEGLKINKTDPEFMLIIGQAYRYSGDRNNAIKWLKRASQGMNDPNLKNFIRELESGGELNPEVNNSVEATSSASIEPNRLKILVESYTKNYEEGNFKASLDIARQLVQLKPSFQHYVLQGMAHESLKYFEKAIQDYREALLIEKSPLVIFQLSNSYMEIGSYWNSIEEIDKLIKSYTSSLPFDLATLYNNKAYALLKLKKYEESRPLIEKALELNSTHWYIWDTRGELYYEIGNYKESISAMSKAHELNQNGNSLFYRGLSYIAIGESLKGCMDLAKASGMGNKDAERELKRKCEI
jgi:tetratricopeptide (TPR) repeat protein